MKKKWSKILFFILISFLFLFIGNCGFGKLLEGDSKLNLQSLKIHGENVGKAELVIYKDITEITANDVTAFFSYDDVEEPVELKVEVRNAPIALAKGIPTAVELYVPSKISEYQSWSKEVTIIVK